MEKMTQEEKIHVVLDIETTGLNPETDRIIEVCAQKLDGEMKAIDEFYALIRIGTPLPPLITKLTGIQDADLEARGEDAASVYSRLHDFLKGTVVVGHNIDDFDMKFLRKAFATIGATAEHPTYDTLKKAKEVFKFYSYKLVDLAKTLNIPSDKFHNARSDVQVTTELFRHLVRAER